MTDLAPARHAGSPLAGIHEGGGGCGGFVVVWESTTQDGDHDGGVFGKGYASSGAPLGSEFQVNTYTTAGQDRAAVATDLSGGFVVVWNSYMQDGDHTGVFGQRFGQLAPRSVAPAMSIGGLLVMLCLLGWFGVARVCRRRRDA